MRTGPCQRDTTIAPGATAITGSVIAPSAASPRSIAIASHGPCSTVPRATMTAAAPAQSCAGAAHPTVAAVRATPASHSASARADATRHSGDTRHARPLPADAASRARRGPHSCGGAGESANQLRRPRDLCRSLTHKVGQLTRRHALLHGDAPRVAHDRGHRSDGGGAVPVGDVAGGGRPLATRAAELVDAEPARQLRDPRPDGVVAPQPVEDAGRRGRTPPGRRPPRRATRAGTPGRRSRRHTARSARRARSTLPSRRCGIGRRAGRRTPPSS